jgi:uncharacterized protein (DUF1697 family)
MSTGTGPPKAYVSLLRGINVGGHNKIKMKVLSDAYRELGFEQVSSYIQSGNLVFISTTDQTTAQLDQQIESHIQSRLDLNVPVTVITAETFKQIVADSPYSGDEEEEKSVFVFIGGEGAEAWAKVGAGLVIGSERSAVEDGVVYLSCPNGLGRSKAANALTARPPVGIKATMRNWRTVDKILEMIEEAEFRASE